MAAGRYLRAELLPTGGGLIVSSLAGPPLEPLATTTEVVGSFANARGYGRELWFVGLVRLILGRLVVGLVRAEIVRTLFHNFTIPPSRARAAGLTPSRS
jgi:hypothetical protein